MTDLKEVLVIGGTGAQGLPVVHSLSASNRYKARVLTRDTNSERAQELARLLNVTLIQGAQDNQKDLHRAFKGVWGAWVNTDGFTIGEKNELFYGIRAYEIARHERVQHYVYASTDYALKDANWDEKYHWGHNDSKGRVTEFILAQGQKGMLSSILTTGPYIDMLFGGIFMPEEQADGSFLWANPARNGRWPLIATSDIGPYSLWMFDNPKETAGLYLKVATDEVTFDEIAATFTVVTGKRAAYKEVPLQDFLDKAEPYPNAPANFYAGPHAARDESTMTWKENFGAWWTYWSDSMPEVRDKALLDKIHPNRIKSLKEWMEKVQYDGKPRNLLKGVEDLQRAMKAGAGQLGEPFWLGTRSSYVAPPAQLYTLVHRLVTTNVVMRWHPHDVPIVSYRLWVHDCDVRAR